MDEKVTGYIEYGYCPWGETNKDLERWKAQLSRSYPGAILSIQDEKVVFLYSSEEQLELALQIDRELPECWNDLDTNIHGKEVLPTETKD